MSSNTEVSRRTIVCGLAAVPTVAASKLTAAPVDDSKLVSLGRELASVWETIAQTADHDEVVALFARDEALSAAIVNTSATTIEGLRVKARATAWALEENFDPTKQPSQNDRMAASIIRDLLQLRVHA